MKRVLTISLLGTTVLLLLVLSLTLPSCGGGGGGGVILPQPNPNNALLSGTYRSGTVEQEWGKVWTRGADLTISGTGSLPGAGTYTIADDRTITISPLGAEKEYGLVSSDGNMAIITDARYDIPGSDDKDVETHILMKKSSGLSCTAVSGDYVVIQAEARFMLGGEYYNFETGRLAMTLKTDCSGTWTILSHSTGTTGSGTIAYALNSDGTFSVTGYYPAAIGAGPDSGVFSPDGSILILTDSSTIDEITGKDTNADKDATLFVAVGVKKSAVLPELSGKYQVHYMGTDNIISLRQFAGRMNATVDTVGTAHFDCTVLADSRGSTWTSTPGYTLNADGTLTITGVGEGVVSPDGSFMTAVDTDPADGAQEIKLIIGLRY